MKTLASSVIAATFEVSTSDVERDLAPLSRSECRHRGLRHSSEDSHKVTLWGRLQWPARERLGEVGL
jgi:hypothetical protein